MLLPQFVCGHGMATGSSYKRDGFFDFLSTRVSPSRTSSCCAVCGEQTDAIISSVNFFFHNQPCHSFQVWWEISVFCVPTHFVRPKEAGAITPNWLRLVRLPDPSSSHRRGGLGSALRWVRPNTVPHLNLRPGLGDFFFYAIDLFWTHERTQAIKRHGRRPTVEQKSICKNLV